MSIIVYTKPACVQCSATFKALDRQGLAYEKVDITLDGQRLERPQTHFFPKAHDASA